MFLNTRSFLFTGVALAGLLAMLGGFLFFSNVPAPGASSQELAMASPRHRQLQSSDIDRIIAERQALAPKPGKQVVARADDGTVAMKAERDALRAQLAANGEPTDDVESRELEGRMPDTVASAAPIPMTEEAEPPAADLAGLPPADKPRARSVVVPAEPAAQAELAARLEAGDGVPADKIEALKLYILARDAANAARLRAELKPAEIAEAERRAATANN